MGVQREQIDLAQHQIGDAGLSHAEQSLGLCLGHALLVNDLGQAHHQGLTGAHTRGPQVASTVSHRLVSRLFTVMVQVP